jgi:hypothetical protein
MAIIGQAFSPEFLRLVLTKEESEKNRNLKAAIADREFQLRQNAQNLEVQQQNIANAFNAQRLRSASSQAKAQLELLKEEGRNERQRQALLLKRQLAEADQARRQADDFSKATLREARGTQILGREGRAEDLHPIAVEQATADLGLTQARADELISEIALNQQKLDDMERTAPDRAALIKAQGDRYAQLIASGEAQTALRSQMAEFAQAIDLENLHLSRQKAFIALNKIMSTFDVYNQSLDDRAAQGGAAAAALRALKMLQDQWELSFAGTNGAQPDFESLIRSILARANPGITQQQAAPLAPEFGAAVEAPAPQPPADVIDRAGDLPGLR